MPYFKTSVKLSSRKVHRKPAPIDPKCCRTCGKKVEVFGAVDSVSGRGFCTAICWILRT